MNSVIPCSKGDKCAWPACPLDCPGRPGRSPETTLDAPSPFISGTRVQWAWDSTSLGWLKECPRKYYYLMVEGWRTKGEAIHLEFGILYHSALESYDRLRAGGLDHEESLRTVVQNVLHLTWRDGRPWRSAVDLDPEDKASLKCREYLIRTIVWYLDKFKDDPAKTKMAGDRPMVEMHFQFELSFNYDIKHPYTLCGYLDRVVDFNEQTFVMDRKTTTSTLGSYYFDQFDPDNQMTLYTVASQVAFHTPVKGVIVDAAQIAVGFSRFGRSLVMKTGEQIDEWMEDTKFWIRQAERFAESGRWPMNDKSCHKYGGCPFVPICRKSPQVREKFLESGFERSHWNPLELRG